MLPERPCIKCGKLFRPKNGRPNAKYCSIACYGRAPRVTPPTFVCEGCGKTVQRRRFKMADGRELGYDYTARFCSRECGYQGRKWRPQSSDGYLHTNGYIVVSMGQGRRKLKHRLVMEQTLGRELVEGENVHHLDGDRTNNAIENLELWNQRQPPGQRAIDKVRFSIEMLKLYPGLALGEGYRLVKEH